MKAIILARVSDKKQDSNEAQVNRVSDYVRSKGLTAWKTYEIEESSTRGDREKFQEVVKEIQQSKEPIALVVDTVDRLQRSFKESVLLDDLRKAGKIEIHFYRESLVLNQNSNSSDLLRWDMAVMFARSYVLQLSDNVKRKQAEMRRNGIWTGKPPIGYKNIESENGKKDIILDHEREHLVRALFELYATGAYSITTLWQKITQMGLRSVNNNKLARSHVQYILNDFFYYGIACPRKKDLKPYPHKYPHIIERELFEKCQEVQQKRARMPSKQLSNDLFIFKGLLPCKNCGCLMSPEAHKKKSGRTYIYYSCTNAKRTCKREYVTEQELLKPIYEVLDDFGSIPSSVQEKLVLELRRAHESEAEYHNQQITRIQSEYTRMQSRIDQLLDMRLDQSITKDDYDKKLQELKDKQYLLNIELEEHTKADHEYHIHVATVFNLASRMREIFESSEPLEKRAFLNFLLQNPTVSGKKLEFSLRKPFDTILSIAHYPTGLPG